MYVRRAFVGREPEIERLRDCALAARTGQPWIVLVEGDAGIGKSELLRHWLVDRSLADFTVLRARCDASEQDLVFGVVQQLVSLVPAGVLQDFPLLKGPVPATAAAFHVGGQLLGLVSVLESVQPVAVVLDDLQWADRASLQAWGFVLRRLDADSLLTVVTVRTTAGGPNPDLDEALRRMMDGASSRLRLPLRGLDTGQVAELIEQATGRQVPESVAEQLRRHTAGNPLYVSTVMAELPEEDLTEASATVLPVPPSLTAAIRAQLLDLPGPSRALVEAAAILGTPTPLPLVGRLAGVEAAAAALEAALATGLMLWRPSQPSTPVEIAHTLQQQAVVEAIPPDRRRHLHATAGRLVDRHAAWGHRVAAAEPTDVRLAAELAEAADEAFADGEADRSATLLLWAADLETARAARERHLLIAAVRLATFDRFTRLTSLLPRVLASTPCAMRSLALGANAMSRDTLPAAEAHFTAALAQSEREADAWAETMAYVWISAVHNFSGRYREGTEAARRAMALAPGLSWARGNLSTGLALAEGPRAALRELAEVTPSIERSAGQGGPVDAFLLTLQGMFRIGAGAVEAGVEDCARALDLSRSRGAPALPDFAYVGKAAGQYLLGDWDGAAISVEHAQAITSNGDGMTVAHPWEFAIACWLAAGQGEWDRAEQHLRAVEDWSRAGSGDYGPMWTAVSRAMLAQARGDHRAMLEAVEPLGQADTGWSLYARVFWLPLHAEALVGVGRREAAEAAVARLRAASQDIPCLQAAAFWLSGRLAERHEDWALARTTYEQGLASLPEKDVVVLHRAMLEHACGRALHRAGLTAEATQRFDQARYRLRNLRARPFLERWTEDAPTPPHRPSCDGRRSRFQLTSRERDIAHLIGRGLTNREIASELFLSVKTVEYHLGRIYRRLGLANRRALRDYVQQAGTGTGQRSEHLH
ncbi:AAA family ATPase [Streptomyces sp. NPDC051001]|uniref:helix-turn-helix transcriptional regulator n=1 Tax=Streptomyces sp. NPDC051001 TaxID=3155795 RepID=UPI0034259B51